METNIVYFTVVNHTNRLRDMYGWAGTKTLAIYFTTPTERNNKMKNKTCYVTSCIIEQNIHKRRPRNSRKSSRD